MLYFSSTAWLKKTVSLGEEPQGASRAEQMGGQGFFCAALLVELPRLLGSDHYHCNQTCTIIPTALGKGELNYVLGQVIEGL
mmetsp:Transcript_41069/g.76393  ORF Transcript_41069/g.76393 Transcript_41069/m.76393 type:complete len:82 (-) Transcript_41069:1054-1299(-)